MMKDEGEEGQTTASNFGNRIKNYVINPTRTTRSNTDDQKN